MRRIRYDIQVFLEGLFFWAGASAGVAYLPSLAGIYGLTSLEQSFFFASMAIGRTFFQPIAGLLVSPVKTYMLRWVSLVILAGMALATAFVPLPAVLIIARFAEGVCLSIYIVSLRTLLNGFSQQPIFESVNDAYTISQSTGRLVGPAFAALLASIYGPRGVFIGSALTWGLCLLFNRRYIQYEIVAPVIQHEIRSKWQSYFMLPICVQVLEFFSLGFWLVVWPVFLGNIDGVRYSALGLFFTASACGGLFWPLLRRFFHHQSFVTRMRGGLLILALTSFLPAMGGMNTPLLIILAILSGIGSTAYFTSFHHHLSDTFSVHEIPKIYGILGSVTFFAQATGQIIAPSILILITPSSALLLNSAILILSTVLLSIHPRNIRATKGE